MRSGFHGLLSSNLRTRTGGRSRRCYRISQTLALVDSEGDMDLWRHLFHPEDLVRVGDGRIHTRRFRGPRSVQTLRVR